MEQQKLGKYDLRRELGRGGAGVIYEAWDPDLARLVAIKTVRLPPAGDAETERQLARFRQEAQAAARLSHPNIVAVYDYGRAGDLSFIAMEFIEGGSLKQRLGPGGALAPAEAVGLIRQVLAGLAASHAVGVVHRDIKPENIMLRDGQAKIADFGIARISSSQLTQDGTLTGTPPYMSPEQFRGETVDLRTDIWSAGVLLYQLLTGRRPFEGSGFAPIMNKVLNTEPPPPSGLCPPGQIPPALDRAVMKALDKRLSPDGRFASAVAFSQALEGVFDEATLAFPPTRPSAPARRRRRLPWAGTVALLLLAAGGGGWWLASRGTPRPPASPPFSPSPAHLPAAPALPTPPPSLADLRSLLATADCTLVSGTIETTKIILTGLVAADLLPPVAAAYQALRRDAPPGRSTEFAVLPLDRVPAYCAALDAIRPFADPIGSDPTGGTGRGMAVQIDTGGARLRERSPFSLIVTMPEFAGWVQIDYFSGGTVAHLGLRPAGRWLGAGARMVVYQGIATDPGTDLVVAIAARERPLFPQPRPETEPAAAYLEALRTALRDRLPATLSAHAIRVVTER